MDGATVDDAEYLDLFMSKYKLIECSSNYSETRGNLCFYHKDESTNFVADIANINNFESIKNLSYS